jgi:hypothetical protein
LLTQWIAKYGYVPIVLIGMACLAFEIGTGEWKSGGTLVAEAPIVAETFVELACIVAIRLRPACQ